MQLTFETYWQGEWHVSAVGRIMDDSLGYKGPSDVEYELDYFIDKAAIDFHDEESVRDVRAPSVNYPVSLAGYYSQTGPPFMLDLMPQGHARRKLADYMRIGVDARESDLPLLLRTGGNPIGNIRIKEAAEAEEQRLAAVRRVGVTERDILERSELFVEVFDSFGMIASGSSGLQ